MFIFRYIFQILLFVIYALFILLCIAIGLSIILGILWGLWYVMGIVKITPDVRASICAGMITIISSVWIATYNARVAKEKISFQALREKKADMFECFMKLVIDVMQAVKKDKSVLPKDFEKRNTELTRKVMLYGGPGVIIAFGKWKDNGDSKDFRKIFESIDDLLKEMRLDLGEKNDNIEKHRLMSLFIAGGLKELQGSIK